MSAGSAAVGSGRRDNPSASAPPMLPPDPASPVGPDPNPTLPRSGSESYVLRPATIADLDEIWAIEAAVFGDDAWSRDLMREELAADHRVYLALVSDSGVVVGYGGLLAVGADADIQTIAVVPGARGSGNGRRVMEALLHAAGERGVREVFLEVRADNPIARGLYQSLEFEEIGVRPRYYQPGNVDAIVMRRTERGRA